MSCATGTWSCPLRLCSECNDRLSSSLANPVATCSTEAVLEPAILGQLELALGQLLNVDVLEGHDPHVLDEPGRPIDIPHPRIGHRDVEEIGRASGRERG